MFADECARFCSKIVEQCLAQFDSVALLGPRQVGKTTLARKIVADLGDNAQYLDLESPADRALVRDPEAFFGANADRLIVLDEVQRLPEASPRSGRAARGFSMANPQRRTLQNSKID